MEAFQEAEGDQALHEAVDGGRAAAEKHRGGTSGGAAGVVSGGRAAVVLRWLSVKVGAPLVVVLLQGNVRHIRLRVDLDVLRWVAAARK